MPLNNKPSRPGEGTAPLVNSPVTHAKYKLSGADQYNSAITLASGSANASVIHQCSSTALDEIYLWCGNYGSADAKLYVSVGDDTCVISSISKEAGLVQILPGVPHQGISITAHADTASCLRVMGYVARHYLIVNSNPSFGYDSTE